MLKNISMPFDAYERNRKIAGLVKKGETVLDVGGGTTGLKLFINNKVVTVDLETGDVKADATKRLPFGDKSFDVVSCVDVLEHIPPAKRSSFLKNIERVGKKRIIISTPFGTPGHEAAEKKLYEELKRNKIEVSFLREHVQNGLPKPEEVYSGVNYERQVFYSGDFRVSNFLFRLHVFETKNPYIDKPLLIVKMLVNVFANLFLYPFWFSKKHTDFTNRFYVVFEK